MGNGDWAVYGIALVGLVVLAYAAIGALSPPSVQFDSAGNVIASEQNRVAFAKQAQSSGLGECGDLRDTANVQHLSHHPSQYASCLQQVEPGFLQQATGQTLQEILGGSGAAAGADPMAGHHG